MSKPTKALISTAYHEAGHAVAAYFENIKVKQATIVPDDDFFGMVTHQQIQKHIRDALEFGSITPTKRARTESFIIVSLAGSIAEQKHRGRSNYVGSAQDRHDAVELVSRLSGSEEEANAYLKWLHVRAANLIKIHWWAVDAVAKALLDSETLTGDELQQVIRTANSNQTGMRQ